MSGSRKSRKSLIMKRRSRPSSPCIAETIAIGSELLVGGRADSNSLFLADVLGRVEIGRAHV